MSYDFYKDKLTEDNLIIFNEIEYYGIKHSIDIDFKEERLNELMDNILEAQSRGDDISFIVGQDIQLFCKEFYDDYTIKDRIFALLKSFRYVALVGFVLTFFDASAFSISGVLIGILSGMIGMTLIVMIVSPLVRKNRKIYKYLDTFIIIGSIAILAVAIVICLNTDFEIVVPNYILQPFFGIYALIGYAIPAYYNFRRYGTIYIKKDNDPHSRDEDIIQEWAKEATKKNYSREEWIEKLDKRYSQKYEKLVDIIIVIVAVIFCGPAVIYGDWITRISCTIGLFVGYKFYRFMTNATKQARMLYNKVKQEVIEDNITIQEYAKRIR